MGQTSESLDLNGRGAFLSAGLPSPSSLRDATSPKVRGLGSPQSFRFGIFTPCCRKGSRQALRGDFPPLPRAPPLGELDAVRRPERARTLPGRLRVSFDQTYDKSQCRPPRRGGAASDWESYHLNPHFLKYRIRFPACQRAGFRLRWAARCHAWMAVYWGTR